MFCISEAILLLNKNTELGLEEKKMSIKDPADANQHSALSAGILSWLKAGTFSILQGFLSLQGFLFKCPPAKSRVFMRGLLAAGGKPFTGKW